MNFNPSLVVVHFIKFSTGKSNTASYNRFLHITKMTSINFPIVIHETRSPNSFLNQYKLFRGVFWILEFGRIVNRISKDKTNTNRPVLYLFGINLFMAVYLSLVKQRHKILLISERNECPVSFMKKRKFLFFLERKLLYPWFYNIFDGYTIISDELIKLYSKYVRETVVIKKLMMTVDFNRFRVIGAKTPNFDYIFFSGSLKSEKDGIDMLIKSFDRFSKLYPDVRLLIAGNSGDKDVLTIHKMLKSTNNNNIILLGMVEREEIPHYLVNAKACVLPRPDSIQARGGFPTKLGEYLASGSPTIVTNVGEIPILLNDNEVLFIDKEDIENSLYNKLLIVFNDYNSAELTGKNGRLKAEQLFNLENNAFIINDLITQVIKNKH
ncbi:MAG: glycosyltransferase family 4 protein [Acholeplasma sp.]|nr:glycosyltransferase family 4 protein [Acholeplasma sp.]